MKEKCKDGCTYSKAMGQTYPRRCIICGHLEPSTINNENIKIFRSRPTNLQDLAQLMALIDQRNQYILQLRKIDDDKFFVEMIEHVNDMIKRLLNI